MLRNVSGCCGSDMHGMFVLKFVVLNDWLTEVKQFT